MLNRKAIPPNFGLNLENSALMLFLTNYMLSKAGAKIIFFVCCNFRFTFARARLEYVVNL